MYAASVAITFMIMELRFLVKVSSNGETFRYYSKLFLLCIKTALTKSSQPTECRERTCNLHY